MLLSLSDTEAEQSARDVSDQYADITAFHDVQVCVLIKSATILSSDKSQVHC